MAKRKNNKEEVTQKIANVKNELMAKVLKELEDEGISFSSVSFCDGYYIFDFGEDTVCHFRAEGVKRWQFGIWAFEDENEETHDKTYKVSLFGEHDDYIDKFKPTQTNLSYTFEFNELQDLYDAVETSDFANDIRTLEAHPALEKYFRYSARTGSVVGFLLDDFWFYRIKNPIGEWCKKNLLWWYLRFVACVYNLRFRRNGVNFKAEVTRRDEGWYPMYELRAIYGLNDDCTVEDIYYKLQKEYMNKCGYRKWKYWLMPKHISNQINFTNAIDENDWHGFYYTEDNDEEQ